MNNDSCFHTDEKPFAQEHSFGPKRFKAFVMVWIFADSNWVSTVIATGVVLRFWQSFAGSAFTSATGVVYTSSCAPCAFVHFLRPRVSRAQQVSQKTGTKTERCKNVENESQNYGEPI